jgi:RNA polymerase sigma-70 factor (ECF subfamily)
VAVRATETTERLRDAGYSALDDRMLVLDFQAGHEDEAYHEIYRRYAGLARHVAFRILADRDVAEEVVQETMLRVYQGLPRFNGRYLLQPWVARIATNVSLDVLRARQRRPQLSDRSLAELVDEIAWDDEDLDDTIDRILERDEVRAVLAELPDHHREALVQREFDGRSHEEIAANLGMTAPQAKALIHRAKGSFRRAWEGDRRGLAAWLPWYLLPNLFRKVQGATEAAATRVATSPVVQSVAPAATEQTVSTADRITTAVVVVALASTVGVGTVAVKKAREQSTKEPAPVAAAPETPDASAPSLAPKPDQPKAAKEQAGRDKDAKDRDAKGNDDVDGTVAPVADETASSSGTPSDSPSPSGSPSTSTPTPEPPPPAPAWTGSFVSQVPFGGASLALVSSKGGFVPSGDTIFSQTVQGSFTHRKLGDGTVYLEYWGSASPAGDGIITMWLFVDTVQGRFRYEASGYLQSAVLAEDGSATRVFIADYVLTEWPAEYDGPAMPHDGAATFMLRFWQDGTLVQTGIALAGSAA